MTDQNPSKTKPQAFQLIWGIALLVVGASMMFRIPESMQRLQELTNMGGNMVFARICLYIVSIILVGGGGMKVAAYYRGVLEQKDRRRDD